MEIKVNPNLAQNFWEFCELLRFVKGNSLLEIGSRHGESLIRFAMQMPHNSRIVSVDDNSDTNFNDGADYMRFNSQMLSKYDLKLINGNSHDPSIIEEVRSLGPYDFLFIDGDHSYEGVKKDFENYGPMSKVIAFHDIKLGGITEFWNEIRTKESMVEFVHAGSRGSMGIGVLIKDI